MSFQEHKTLVIKDYVEACVWYQKAADAGDKKALAKLNSLRRSPLVSNSLTSR